MTVYNNNASKILATYQFLNVYPEKGGINIKQNLIFI